MCLLGIISYNLFFGSFDALVMLATIYIIFPQEHPEMKQSALNQFHWTIERFSAMQERNPLARSAQGVLKAILVKFTRAINSTAEPSASAPSSVTPASTRGTADSTTSTISSARGFGDQGSTALLTSNEEREGTRGDLPTFAVPPMTMGRGDWSMPSMDTLASLAPLYPTYDLIFNDLNVVDDGMPPLGDAMPWQFGGHLGEDTVWQLLNQYEPGTSGS